jgi:hypothetical protein
LGITLNGNLSAKMAENWTKHLEKLSLGEVDTTSLNKALNGMLEGLSVEQTELLMAQLNNVDFSNIESWD